VGLLQWQVGPFRLRVHSQALPCSYATAHTNNGFPDLWRHCYRSTHASQTRNEVKWRRGKKQVWRPRVRTWGLSEANLLHWKKYVWLCGAPRSDLAPGDLSPLSPSLRPWLSCFFSQSVIPRGVVLSAVTVSLCYLPRSLSSSVTRGKTPTTVTWSEPVKISCYVIIT